MWWLTWKRCSELIRDGAQMTGSHSILDSCVSDGWNITKLALPGHGNWLFYILQSCTLSWNPIVTMWAVKQTRKVTQTGSVICSESTRWYRRICASRAHRKPRRTLTLLQNHQRSYLYTAQDAALRNNYVHLYTLETNDYTTHQVQ